MAAKGAPISMTSAKECLHERNVGSIDRILRVVIGLTMVVMSATGTIAAWGYIGVVPLVTGLIGTCPLYRLLGLSTCPLSGRT